MLLGCVDKNDKSKDIEPEINITGGIGGFATDAHTGAVIPGVLIRAGLHETLSSSDGTYALSDISLGEIFVGAEKEGYKNYEKQISITEERTKSHDIIMDPISIQIADGLVGYYVFDGNANDISGNKNHGKEVGIVSYRGDCQRRSTVLSLDGASGYIRIKNPTQKFDNAFTIALRMSSTDQPGQVISKFSSNGSKAGMMVAITDSGMPLPRLANHSFKMNYIVTDQDDWTTSSNLDHIYYTKRDYSFVLVYENNTSKLYLNFYTGNEVEVQNATSIMSLDNDYDILLGTYFENDGMSVALENNKQGFKGTINELRIYNKALSEEEIKDLGIIYFNAFP